MTTFLSIFLDASPASGGQSPSMMPTLLMFVALGVIMYVFMIRPQQKKQKEERKFRDALTVGQDVVTIGGVHGSIKSIEDNIIVLHVATGVDIRIEKAAINPTASQTVQK